MEDPQFTELSPPVRPSEGPKSIVPWNIRQAGQIGREPVRALTLLHDGFARRLTHAPSTLLCVEFGTTLVSADQFTYREFLRRLPEMTYLCSCRLMPMNVKALLQLDLSIAFPRSIFSSEERGKDRSSLAT